ncbi:MAG: diguanylate cyclase [Anaerolineae bacterium]|nr:diguanylate cyclase [Anaerolineae bacterium]
MRSSLTSFEFDKEEDRRVARLISVLIYISWGAYAFAAFFGILFKDWILVAATIAGCILLIIPFVMVRRGKLQFSSFSTVLSVLFTLTFIATIGQGIRDLSIIALPIVIIFSGLTLDRLHFKISVATTILAISWLAIGENQGWFHTKPFEGVGATWASLAMVSILFLIAAIAVDLLAQNTRENLQQAQTEIAQRIQTEADLREKEFQYHNLADSGIVLIWTSGTDKLCNYFNLPWLRFTGRTLEQELGNGWTEGLHPDDYDHCLHTYITAFEKREKFDMEYRMRHVSGDYRWIQDLGTPTYNSNGEFVGYIRHCFDITERKQLEEQLRYQGSRDAMTGLYNRNFFEAELERFAQGRDFPVSVIMADIDGLKYTNDTRGHAAGDELLKRGANILSSGMRNGDIVARIGGDEFAMLLPRTDAAMVKTIVERIKNKIGDYNSGQTDLPLKISLGCATTELFDLMKALKLADQNMYADKIFHKVGRADKVKI